MQAVWILVAWLVVSVPGQAQAESQSPPREALPQPTGLIAGVVVIAGSGLPLDGASVTLSGAEIRGNRRAVTDDDGRFQFAHLPAGRYNLTASKRGYVNVVYGQLEPGTGRQGTPIQLVQGQAIKDIRLAVPRGGVITGQVFDEKGRPAVAAAVRVSRWVMTTGERRLTGQGNSSTDDRGMYRVFGLAPGAYVVHAVPRNPSADERVGYAPVYYPGTLELAGAQTLQLGVSEERVGVDLHLQQVPLATVSGQLLLPAGVSMSNVRVRLVNLGTMAPGVATPNTRATSDGSFVFNGVAPGQYRAFAVASARNVPASAVGSALGGEPLPEGRNTLQFWASADVSVFGEAVSGLTMAMQPGMIVSGQMLFDGFSQPRPTDLRRVRVTLTPDTGGQESGVSSLSATLDQEGRFRLLGVVPGRYRIRATGATSGWWPKSAMVGGRDALDFDLEVPERESVSNVLFTLSDRSAELSGTLRDSLSRPAAELTVILFSADSRYWVPASRRIASARPATDGRFVFAGLPAGDYRLAAVADLEPGAWYDPEVLRQLVGGSVLLSLTEGERRVQDLQVGR